MSLVVGAALAAQPPQMPTFKARVDLVRVDALVVDDGRPVEGLKASDFVIRDNGVEQTVESIQQIAEVTAAVVLDVSGSMSGDRLKLAAGAASQLLNELERPRSIRAARLRRPGGGDRRFPNVDARGDRAP